MKKENALTSKIGYIIKVGCRYLSEKSTIAETVITPEIEKAMLFDSEGKAQQRLLDVVSSMPNADICEVTMITTPSTSSKSNTYMMRLRGYAPENPYLKRYLESQKG